MLFPNKKLLENLSLEELDTELNPEKISTDLRWSEDIDYQKAVAIRIDTLLIEKPSLLESISTENLYQKMGWAFIEGSDCKKAKNYFERSLSEIAKIDDRTQKNILSARCHLGLGCVAREHDKNLVKATEHFVEASIFCEKFKETQRVRNFQRKLKEYRSQS